MSIHIQKCLCVYTYKDDENSLVENLKSNTSEQEGIKRKKIDISVES